MTNEPKIKALIEELEEVETFAELQALADDLREGEHASMTDDARVIAVFERKSAEFADDTPIQNSATAELAVLKAKLEELKQKKNKAVIRVERLGRKYKLLSFDVKWSTKPQVHAIMAVLAANANVGDVLEEAQIVHMMKENEDVLGTKQGGKRIWDYYKGNHATGLLMHGNVERM